MGTKREREIEDARLRKKGREGKRTRKAETPDKPLSLVGLDLIIPNVKCFLFSRKRKGTRCSGGKEKNATDRLYFCGSY